MHNNNGKIDDNFYINLCSFRAYIPLKNINRCSLNMKTQRFLARIQDRSLKQQCLIFIIKIHF